MMMISRIQKAVVGSNPLLPGTRTHV